MKQAPSTELTEAFNWCTSVLGPVQTMADRSNTHGGHESSTCRLRTQTGFCHLKVHQTRSHWNRSEFAWWDVRVADFSRDPDWSWIRRPDLHDAFLEGYGRRYHPTEAKQVLVAHAEYALDAILWGLDHAFFGFEQEGRDSLAHLAPLLR